MWYFDCPSTRLNSGDSNFFLTGAGEDSVLHRGAYKRKIQWLCPWSLLARSVNMLSIVISSLVHGKHFVVESLRLRGFKHHASIVTF
jgi:hypothetical protein